ncbi:hypothetical protein ACP4OV_017939 [Aristida adscensionis]
MAGRLVIQRLASWVSRSRRSHLGHHAFASLPVTPAAASAKAMYFSSRPTSTMPSMIITHMKPTSFGSLRGAKQPFSSDASKGSEISKETDIWVAEQKAKLAAIQARHAAQLADIDRIIADFRKFTNQQIFLWSLTCACWIVGGIIGGDYKKQQRPMWCSNS